MSTSVDVTPREVERPIPYVPLWGPIRSLNLTLGMSAKLLVEVVLLHSAVSMRLRLCYGESHAYGMYNVYSVQDIKLWLWFACSL